MAKRTRSRSVVEEGTAESPSTMLVRMAVGMVPAQNRTLRKSTSSVDCFAKGKSALRSRAIVVALRVAVR